MLTIPFYPGRLVIFLQVKVWMTNFHLTLNILRLHTFPKEHFSLRLQDYSLFLQPPKAEWNTDLWADLCFGLESQTSCVSIDYQIAQTGFEMINVNLEKTFIKKTKLLPSKEVFLTNSQNCNGITLFLFIKWVTWPIVGSTAPL